MKPVPIIVLVLVLLAFAAKQGAYVVHEWDQVVITQFGDPVGEPVREPGLHFKIPFTQHVNRLDKRVLEWDGERNQIPTADKRYIWIDTTARWRISDPLLFLQAVRSEAGAQTRLDDILDSATRNQISAFPLAEVVRSTNRVVELPRERERDTAISDTDEPIAVGREGIADLILDEARALAPKYGIELLDLRIKRINYVEHVRNTVYQRMISERKQSAEEFRSEGEGKKSKILGDRDREQKKIDSEAYRLAQELVATADAEAARIFATAYDADPEFYAFIRSLETYRAVVGQNHTLVIDPKSDLYRYLFSAEKRE